MSDNIYAEVKHAKCDVCGASGIFREHRDIFEVEQSQASFDREGPRGRKFRFGITQRFGCDAHPVIVNCYNLDGSICPTPPHGWELSSHHASTLFVPKLQFESVS